MATPSTNDVTINGETVKSPIQVGGISDVLPKIITIVLTVATLLTLAMLLWGGIQYIAASGDIERTQKAKATITHALIGLAISALAVVIWTVAGNIIGFKLL